MTDPRDGQPHDAFGNADGPPPPTTPPTSPGFGPAQSAFDQGQSGFDPAQSGFDPAKSGFGPAQPPTSGPMQPPWASDAGEEPEYVVHSGPHPVPPTSFQNAPDPFGGADTGGGAVPPGKDGAKKKGNAKRWIIPTAALVVLAVVAAAVYFLFFQSDSNDDKKADTPPTSEQAEPDREDGGSSESESTESEGAGAEAPISGTFQVNGTIESYTGPPTGQLGGTPKTAGSPAFTSPQTWTINGCTDTTCELTVEQGGMTLTLELADGTWSGQTTQQIACSPTAGAMTDATISIEIPEDGATAKRTLSAQCDEPIEEIDALTLTPQ